MNDLYTNFEFPKSYPEFVIINDLLTKETLPDGALSDGALSDGTLPDGALSDGTLPDGTLPDGTLPDGTSSVQEVNLLESILLGILPSMQIKENFKKILKDTKLAKEELNYNSILLKYLNDVCNDLQNQAVLEALTLKIKDSKSFVKQIQSLPPHTLFKYSEHSKYKEDLKSKESKEIDLTYSNTLKNVLDEVVLKEKPIEKDYASAEDLLYDIYLAGQYLTFFAIFSPVVFKEIFLGKNLKYSIIINLFYLTPDDKIFTTVLLKENFKLQVLDKENFLKMKEKPLYVTEELKYPGNLSENIFYNITFQQRQARLKDLKMIYTFFAFLENNVKHEINIYLQNLSVDGKTSEQVDTFFQSPQDYQEYLKKELNELKISMLSLFSCDKNPLIEKISDLNIESSAKVQKDFDGLLAEESKKFELLVHRHPIDFKDIDIQKHTLIEVKFYMEKKYNFLAPTSTEFPFTVKNLFFPSIAHYSLFKIFQTFLNLSEDNAYELMSKTDKQFLSYEEYEKQFESTALNIIRNRFAQSTISTLKLWCNCQDNMGKIPKNKNLIFKSENKFLGLYNGNGFNFIGKYFMVLRDGLKEIKDPTILLWFDNKLADMTSAIGVLKLTTDVEQKRFLEKLFRFPSACGSIKIILEDRDRNAKNKIVFDYLSNFIASTIIEIGVKAFSRNIKHGRMMLQKPDITKSRFSNDFPKMCIALRSNFDISTPATSDEVSFLLTIISRSLVKVEDIENAWKLFSMETDADEKLNRFNFFSSRLLATYEYMKGL